MKIQSLSTQSDADGMFGEVLELAASQRSPKPTEALKCEDTQLNQTVGRDPSFQKPREPRLI